MAFWLQLVLSLVLMVVAYLIMPKPKQQQPPETQDMDDPVAEAGKEVMVVFGTKMIKGLNVLGYWDKQKVEREVAA